MNNQKDVSLAHLKALLAMGYGSPCCYCANTPKPDNLEHATNCVYVAAQDHVDRINEHARSEAMRSEKSARPRYSDHPGG